MSITIQNKLRVLRGNKLVVPGREPISAFTSPTLAANMQSGACVVDLKDALDAIPGSTIVYSSNPRETYFVLPDGPQKPPSACDNPCNGAVNDWYQVLRDLSSSEVVEEEQEREPSLEELCRGIPLKGIF